MNKASARPYILRLIRLFLGLVLLLPVTIPVQVAAAEETVIDDYAFGRMTINRNNYNWDISINENGRVKSWGFSDDHRIILTDVKHLLSDKTRVLIIGTGHNGVAEVNQEVLDYLREKGVVLHLVPTAEAAELYNKSKKSEVVACFHLDC